jgi:hypothetical protein
MTIPADHFPREILLRGGPLDGQVHYVQSPTVKYARQDFNEAKGYVIGEYRSGERYVAIRWDLPDDGSLQHPDVFLTGMGRKVFDLRVFDWAGEESP